MSDKPIKVVVLGGGKVGKSMVNALLAKHQIANSLVIDVVEVSNPELIIDDELAPFREIHTPEPTEYKFEEPTSDGQGLPISKRPKDWYRHITRK